jgi:adenosylcobinamide-GDP ribazoletransferase
VALAGLDAVLLRALPVSVATVLLLGASILATGGLHLDGLMDACDGLFGGRTAARRLEIMRDSRVGSYGVLAGVVQLLLKYAVLGALAPALRGPALVAALTAGRWTMVGATWTFAYARPEGLGAGFKAGVTWVTMALATLFAAAACWAALGPIGLALLALAGVIGWLAGAYASGKLGGLTGDCYGALNEVVETAVLLAILVLAGGPSRA